MNVDIVSKAIKKKFGSRNKFCRCSGFDPVELNRILAAARKNLTEERINKLNHLLDLVKSSDPEDDIENHVTKHLREKMNQAIEDKGGVIEFTSNNNQFKLSSVYAILEGRRPRRTDKVNSFIKALGLSI